MSSRELVVLVTEFSDTSRFKRRFGSGWSTAEMISARHANDYRAAHTEEGKPVDELIPPNSRDDEDDIDSGPAISVDQLERMVDGDMSVYDEFDPAA